jgi:membrane protein implicated in regulation of membrane protease activity
VDAGRERGFTDFVAAHTAALFRAAYARFVRRRIVRRRFGLVAGTLGILLLAIGFGYLIFQVADAAQAGSATPGLASGMDPVAVAFLMIGAVAVAVLAISLLLSDVFSIGHADYDGPFSVPAVAAFVGAFGFAGAIAAYLVPGPIALRTSAGVAVGLAAALPAAWLAMRLVGAAMAMSTDPTPTRADLVGTLGVVVTPINSGGYGEVRVILAGQPVKLNAKSDHPVALGATVFVVEAPSSTSVLVEETLPLEEGQ